MGEILQKGDVLGRSYIMRVFYTLLVNDYYNREFVGSRWTLQFIITFCCARNIYWNYVPKNSLWRGIFCEKIYLAIQWQEYYPINVVIPHIKIVTELFWDWICILVCFRQSNVLWQNFILLDSSIWIILWLIIYHIILLWEK